MRELDLDMEGAQGANSNVGATQEGHQVEIAVMEVMHKVVPPPPRSSLDKIKVRLKETFFPDDPFRRFKGQPPKKKWILGAQYLFPILGWAPTYNFSLFKSDLVSGLTIASLAIPQVSVSCRQSFFFITFSSLPSFLDFILIVLCFGAGNQLCPACQSASNHWPL